MDKDVKKNLMTQQTCSIDGCIYDTGSIFGCCPVCRLHKKLDSKLKDLETRIMFRNEHV